MNRAAMALAAAMLLLAAGCERELRQFRSPPSASTVDHGLRVGSLQPGQPLPPADMKNPYEENAYAVSQGKRWFRWYNCSGCHGNGGGGSGPALIDSEWIYGSEPAQVYATIAQGRPNGMPSFRGHIPEDQIWQLVAYVRSMSGQLSTGPSPGQGDTLHPNMQPETRRAPEPRLPATVPASAK
jgi:cytochrome c oxidase cbb3-type subunit 3